MAYKIVENSAQSVISITFYGAVDDEEMLRMMSELYVLESYSTSNQLIDLSQIDDFVVTPSGAVVYNETAMEQPELRAARDDRQIAIYAPDDLSFGMARLIASVASSSGVEMMVYRGLNEALSYVGIEKHLFQQIKSDKSEI